MDFNRFKHHFEEGWGKKLQPFIESKECDEIYAKLKADAGEGKIICPECKNTWRAFQECPWDKLKVVIMSLDPYPYYFNKIYTADGLAFSCRNTQKLQPSLRILYKAIEDDIYNGLNLGWKKEQDLSYLAQQGVLLLNSALTVEKERTGSHTELWKPFQEFLIEQVLNPTMGLIYIFMGKDAQYYEKYVLPFNHWTFSVEHPSNAARREREMRHNNVFSKTNKLLKEIGGDKHQIEWLKIVKP